MSGSASGELDRGIREGPRVAVGRAGRARRPGARVPAARRAGRSGRPPRRRGRDRRRSPSRRESMIASAPSKTAFATSLASARVGRGDEIIDSSIWVATIEGIPRSRARRTSCFWMIGTSSYGSSTPRSPRAIITASATSRIASKSSIAGRVSILATIGGPPGPSNSRRARTSSARRTNDWATYSTPRSSARGTSARSFAVSAGPVIRSDGMLTPARDRIVPPRTTSVSTSPLDGDDPELDRAVREQDPVAGLDVARQRPIRHAGARRVAGHRGSARGSSTERASGLEGRAAAAQVADPDLRAGQVGQQGDAPAGVVGRRTDGPRRSSRSTRPCRARSSAGQRPSRRRRVRRLARHLPDRSCRSASSVGRARRSCHREWADASRRIRAISRR